MVISLILGLVGPNVYSYVFNNPVNLIDSSGLAPGLSRYQLVCLVLGKIGSGLDLYEAAEGQEGGVGFLFDCAACTSGLAPACAFCIVGLIPDYYPPIDNCDWNEDPYPFEDFVPPCLRNPEENMCQPPPPLPKRPPLCKDGHD